MSLLSLCYVGMLLLSQPMNKGVHEYSMPLLVEVLIASMRTSKPSAIQVWLGLTMSLG